MGTRLNLPRLQVEDAAGRPIPGAKLYFYVSGTSTPASTYADQDQATANTNPVVADAAGYFGDIFLASGVVYRVTLTDALGAPIWSADNVSARPDWLDGLGNFPMAGKRVTDLGPALLSTDAAQMGQVGWQQIGPQVVAQDVAVVDFDIPAGPPRLMLQFEDLVCSSEAILFFRFSFDGGVTYAADTDQYGTAVDLRSAANQPVTAVPGIYGYLYPATAFATFGHIEFPPENVRQWKADILSQVVISGAPAFQRAMNFGSVKGTGRVTNIRIGYVNSNVTGGRFRLLGAATV